MKPLTIVHTECSTGWGGQEIRIFQEMKAMRARGHRVLLAAPEWTTIARKCREEHFSVFTFDDSKPAYPFSIIRLARWFRSVRPDVINTHSSRDGWIAGLAARLARSTLLVRSRHIEVSYPNRFLSRIAYHHLPQHVLTTSEAISRGLIGRLGLDPERVDCVPTGIDLERFQPGPAGSVRTELGLQPSETVVSMIAVLRSWKGHLHFLEAAARILAGPVPVQFLIVGEGPMRPAIEARIARPDLHGRVRLLGHREDVPDLIRASDIVVLPSYAHEGIPQILLQAQACGTAVIGARTGGIPEIIEDGRTGLLVPAACPESLAHAILQLATDPARRQDLALHALENVRQKHSLAVMCEQIEAIYARHLPAA